MTIEELYEFAKSIGAENATIELDDYDDTDTYCGDTTHLHVSFYDENEKNMVHLEPKGC